MVLGHLEINTEKELILINFTPYTKNRFLMADLKCGFRYLNVKNKTIEPLRENNGPCGR